MKAVIDEDLPKLLTASLANAGWQVFDVRDIGMRGFADERVAAFAKKQKAVLFSGDWGFANILKFPPQDYYGIVLCHFPNEVSVKSMSARVIKSLTGFSKKAFDRSLIIIEPGKVRIRQKLGSIPKGNNL